MGNVFFPIVYFSSFIVYLIQIIILCSELKIRCVCKIGKKAYIENIVQYRHH